MTTHEHVPVNRSMAWSAVLYCIESSPATTIRWLGLASGAHCRGCVTGGTQAAGIRSAFRPCQCIYFVSLHPCTELARINSCDLDSKLRFQAEDHVYFYDGKRVGCSVACLHLQKCEHTIDMAGTMNTSEKGFR